MNEELQKVPILHVLGKNRKGFLDGNWILSKDMSVDGEVGIVQLKHIGNGKFLDKDFKFITKKKFVELRCTQLEEGDLLVSRMADPICRSCILPKLDFSTVTAVDVTIIRPAPGIADTKYLNYILNTKFLQNQAKKYSVGTTRARISRKNLEKLIIPLPPLTIQKKIVTVLGKAEQLKQWREETEELTDDYLNSIFLEMFGDPITNPKNLELKKFTDIMVLKRGYDLPIQDRISGEYPIAGSNGVVGYNNEFKVEGPGVITGRSGTLGKVQYIEDNYWPLNTSLYSKELRDNNPIYLTYFLRLFKLERFTRGVGVPTLNRNLVHAERALLPPKHLQNKFADIVKRVEQMKEYQKQSKQQIDNHFNVLMQKAFRGELVC